MEPDDEGSKIEPRRSISYLAAQTGDPPAGQHTPEHNRDPLDTATCAAKGQSGHSPPFGSTGTPSEPGQSAQPITTLTGAGTADGVDDYDADERTRRFGPHRHGIVGNLLLLWNFGLLQYGWSRTLVPEDLPALKARHRSIRMSATVDARWAEEEQKAKPSLNMAILRVLGPQFRWGYIIGGIDGLLTTVARPLLLRELIDTIGRGTPASPQDSGRLMGLMIAILILEGWAGVMYRHILTEDTGSAYVAALFSLLLKKILRTSAVAIVQDKVGQDSSSNANKSNESEDVDLEAPESDEVAMFGNDLIRSYNMMMWASGVPIAITGIFGGAGVCIYIIGWIPALCGLAVAALILFINFALTGVQGKVERRTLELADERMSILTQIVETVKAIKFFAWEPEYLDRITSVRTQECRKIREERMLHVTSVALGRTSPVMSAAVAILAYRYLGNKLRTADVFAIVTTFQSMRLPLIMAPLGMAALENVSVSLARLRMFLLRSDHFFLASESCDNNLKVPKTDTEVINSTLATDVGKRLGDINNTEEVPCDSRNPKVSLETSNVVLHLDDATFSWNDSTKSHDIPSGRVSGVNMQIERGTLTAIVGPVGGGKSTLVHGLVGELAPTAGSVDRYVSKTETGYAPQRAFILSGTVRENILFGRPLLEDRLETVLSASAFLKDLNLLPAGIETEIGERGTTLSGGQQQRLSVARALYGRPDLLVLDDPLSAVDSQVCNQMFERAVLGSCRDKSAVVMVLNQIHLLPHFDTVLFVDGGKVAAQGTYTEVSQSDVFKGWVSHIDPAKAPSGVDKSEGAEDDTFDENHTIELSRKSDQTQGRHSIPTIVIPNKLASAGSSDDTHIKHESESPTGDDGEHVRLVVDEKHATGRVSAAVVSKFIRQMGRLSFYGSGLVIFISYGIVAFADIWLGSWAEESEKQPDGELSNSEDTRFASVYGSAVLLLAFGVLAGSYSFCFSGERVSNKLHSQCVTQLLYAPFFWFLETPVGRITSRFSSDLAAVDLYLSFWIDNLFQLGSVLVIFTLAVMVLVPPVIVLVLICGPFFAVVVEAVDRCNREMKRMSNAAMGPVLSNVQEALHGRVLARAMGLELYFVERHHRLVDSFNRAMYSSWCLISFMQFVASATSALVSIAVALIALLQKGSPDDVDTTSVAVMYSFLIPYYMAFVAQIVSMVKMYLTSYERVTEYMSLPQEPPRTLDTDPGTGWPSTGSIEFDNVSMRYRDGLPLAVANLSARIQGGQKIGVVGRTGAGKSSLAAILFRLVEVCEGRVVVDGVDVSKIGLRTLRRAITVIPQDPTLMEGSIRDNLDPFHKFTDDEVQDALERASLSSNLVGHRLSKAGENMSSGERQLLCLARAVLYRAPIVIMDEPTANCDQVTDDAIQTMVRSAFAGSTLFTIAHRLSTIIDYDLILVMDKGRCVELAPPTELLENREGFFSQMVDALGPEGADLRRAATEASREKAVAKKMD